MYWLHSEINGSRSILVINSVRRPGQGRSLVTTAIHELYLRVYSLRQRFATARLLQNQLEQTHGVQIRIQTIRNRLREYYSRPRNAARGPALTSAHRRARLDFAREHIHTLGRG